jgi:hypothetical protein
VTITASTLLGDPFSISVIAELDGIVVGYPRALWPLKSHYSQQDTPPFFFSKEHDFRQYLRIVSRTALK